MMERKCFIYILLPLLLLTLSCSRESVPGEPVPGNGSFVLSTSPSFSVDMTKSTTVHSLKSGEVEVSWSEDVWGFEDLTKSNVTGNEYSWEDSTTVSIYITDTDGNLLVQSDGTDGLGDIPLNPSTYKSYTTYRPYKSNETNKTEITDEQLVSEASFFWNDKKTGRPETMPELVNFYGYYPRPFDGDKNSLFYVKTSIIEKESAHSPFGRDDWYILPYSFSDIQTDENLSYHDVMCSVSEKGGLECNSRYGNQAKGQDSNVQMHFRHIFSLLRIEIDKGAVYDNDGHKDCIVSDLSISGSEIYTQGKLDILTGKTTPALRGSILRDIHEGTSIKDSPLSTTMIVQPISAPADGLSDEQKAGRFVISCKIDGIPFTCSIPDIALEPGKKYDIRLTLTPSGGFVFRVWNGAEVIFGSGEKRYDSSGEYNEVKLDYDGFSVSPDAESKVVAVMCNGKPVSPDESGKFPIVQGSDTPVYYDIVASPSDWYATDAMRIHFDALWNNKYKSTVPDGEWSGLTTWSDLSGHGNDGNLKSFDSSESSGWYEKGLNFDGNDDIVTYPGNINATEYTMELYVYVPEGYRQKQFSRLTAEGGNPDGYPCFYFPGGFSRRLELYAHGRQNEIWGGAEAYFNGTQEPNVNMVQLDCVFSYDDKSMKIYCNGQLGRNYPLGDSVTEALSVPIASLGNRIQDNTRAIKATYYSFILYDRELTEAEIQENYRVNKARYGTLHQ